MTRPLDGKTIMEAAVPAQSREPWNKGKIVGQRHRLSLKTSGRCEYAFRWNRAREIALFNLGIGSKLRGCDLVALRVRHVCHGDQVVSRAVVMQHKNAASCAVRDHCRYTRSAPEMDQGRRSEVGRFFTSQEAASLASSLHPPVRQNSRPLGRTKLGLDPADYGTHPVRRTKAALIYRRTKNLRAVQRFLGHSKLESTVRYLGIDVEDALQISEQPRSSV